MALDSVEKPVMMITGRSRLVALGFADHRQAVHAGHLQIGDEEIVRIHPHPLERRAAVGRDVHVVFGERERLGEQIANARFVVDHEHARTRVAAARAGRGHGRRRLTRTAARPLAVEPGVDVALAEAPLAADADRGNLARP